MGSSIWGKPLGCAGMWEGDPKPQCDPMTWGDVRSPLFRGNPSGVQGFGRAIPNPSVTPAVTPELRTPLHGHRWLLGHHPWGLGGHWLPSALRVGFLTETLQQSWKTCGFSFAHPHVTDIMYTTNIMSIININIMYIISITCPSCACCT